MAVWQGQVCGSVFNRGRNQKTKYNNSYASDMTITEKVRKMAGLDEVEGGKSKERSRERSSVDEAQVV